MSERFTRPSASAVLILAALSLLPLATPALAVTPASSLFAISGVGFGNIGGAGNFDLDSQSTNDSSPVSATVTNQTFTGLDSTGAPRTLTFSGTNQAQASFFSGLHVFAQGSVSNSYHNPLNPKADDGTGTLNPAGSPDSLHSLGFAGFTDTLQYGGSLQAGYKARYIFRVHGSMTDNFPYTAADMGFGIEGNPDESFFVFNPGPTNTIWATQSYDVNGITPQHVHVQFSAQFVMNTFEHADGDNVSGTADFGATLTLEGIEVLDASGNPVGGVTVSSASGAPYTILPEPTSLAACAFAILPLLARRRRA